METESVTENELTEINDEKNEVTSENGSANVGTDIGSDDKQLNENVSDKCDKDGMNESKEAEKNSEDQAVDSVDGNTNTETDEYLYTKRDEFTSEIFKVQIQNLPKRFGFAVSGYIFIKCS